MVGSCCHDPCRDSLTGWTCGSSSSSTWRFSCLSTCCPEGAAQVRGSVRGWSVCLSVGREAPTGCAPWREGSASGVGTGNSLGIPTAPPQKASEAQMPLRKLETNSKPPPALFICLRDLLSALCSGGVIDAPCRSVSFYGLCSTTNITRPFLFPVGPFPPKEFSPISHLMNTGGGRGGPFVRDKHLGTRL